MGGSVAGEDGHLNAIALVTTLGSRVVEGAPGTPFTRTTVAVVDVLKGRLPDRFALQVIGGKLGTTTVESPVQPFVKGRRYILFLGGDGPAGPTLIPQAVLEVRSAGATQVVRPSPEGIRLLSAGTKEPARSSDAGPRLEDVIHSIREHIRSTASPKRGTMVTRMRMLSSVVLILAMVVLVLGDSAPAYQHFSQATGGPGVTPNRWQSLPIAITVDNGPTDISAEITTAVTTWNDVATARAVWGTPTKAVDGAGDPVDFTGANMGTAWAGATIPSSAPTSGWSTSPIRRSNSPG